MTTDDAWAREESLRRYLDLAGQMGLDGSELQTDVQRIPPRSRSSERKKRAGMRGMRPQLVILDEIAGWNES